MGGQRHAPPALLPGKTRYPLYRRLGGYMGLSGRVRKISPPTGIRFPDPDRPARNESLCRLSYPGPLGKLRVKLFIRKPPNFMWRYRHRHHHHHHHHHISIMELGHLLTRSSLTYPEVSSKVYHDSFCQSESSVSLPWVMWRYNSTFS